MPKPTYKDRVHQATTDILHLVRDLESNTHNGRAHGMTAEQTTEAYDALRGAGLGLLIVDAYLAKKPDPREAIQKGLY